jgi:hypothetical protein
MWPKLQERNPRFIELYTRLFAEHAKMLGLNKPVRQEVSVISDSTVDAAIKELTAALNQKAAAAEAAGVDLPEFDLPPL